MRTIGWSDPGSQGVRTASLFGGRGLDKNSGYGFVWLFGRQNTLSPPRVRVFGGGGRLGLGMNGIPLLFLSCYCFFMIFSYHA